MLGRWLARLGALLALVLLALALATPAGAQRRSGGSFGGSHWGGGGGGGYHGGGGGSYGSGRYGGYGGGSYGYRGGATAPGHRGRGGLGGAIAVVVFIAFVLGLFVLAAAQPRRGGLPGPQSPLWNGVDMVRLRLALDWRARRRVQRALQALARTRGRRNQKALARALDATVAALRAERTSWLYAKVDDYRPMSPPLAEGEFRRLTQEARATFEDELVRGDDTSVRQHDATGYRAREADGEGVVVVTLIVASRDAIVDVGASDARAVERVLDALAVTRSDALVALEVAWTPAAEEDRMSTAAMQVRHAGLVALTDIGGRVICGHCRGPYADELTACPHCGAPRAAATRG